LVFAIDPGSEKSAWVIFDEKMAPVKFGISKNRALIKLIRNIASAVGVKTLVIEIVKSYGNVMGDSVLQTVEWIGRFQEAFGPGKIVRLSRKEIVTNICGHARAKDKNVRQAVIDRFGGKEKALGSKKNPGSIYGAKKDIFSALAVGLTYFDSYSHEFLS